MYIENNNKIFLTVLIFISFISLFLGYYLDENSAGAGLYTGDWQAIWNNLQIYLINDLASSLNHPDYTDSRTPIAYIFHELFNPFAETEIGYRRSVFIISLALPVLFYFCLKQRFKKEDNILLLLISSIICLSPYYRTSAYWGLEENYGLISLLLTFLSLNYFLENDNTGGYKIYSQLFLTTFFSSLCLYFDQKLIIVPIICFLKIIRAEKLTKFKIYSIFYYFIFSLPYIYLIMLWGNIFAPEVIRSRVKIGDEFLWSHIGYASTMIAFYLLPLLLFKEKNFHNLFKNFFLNKKNYYLISLFFIYFFYLLNFHNFHEESFLGKGYIHKASIILFEEYFLREIFIYFSFFVSWIIILIYVDRNFKDLSILFYFFVLSIIIWPIQQEYFDPLILTMAFTFFNTKLFISYKNSLILFLYLSIFLICSNIYYSNLLN